MSHDKYTAAWGTTSHYPVHGANNYSQSAYAATSGLQLAHGSSAHTASGYYDPSQPRSIHSNYPSGYHNNAANYPTNSSTSDQQHLYSPVTPTSPTIYGQTSSIRSGANTARPQSTAPQYYSHSPSHSYSLSTPYSQTPSSPIAEYPQMERPRSHSQAHKFPPSSSPYPQPQYTEVSIPQTISISSDMSCSPQRPYSCDLCALSFNRQHDLKRHRETHTGEKPFFCNGGCGKTFTRKDALKRHQLVKSCGKVDDNNS